MSTPERLLLIDDDDTLRELIEEELRRRGYSVVAFSSAEEALGRVQDPDIGVVLTDINMSGMTGLELCQRVLAVREDLPVVVMTAFGTMETAIGAIRAGAYDFIVKPFEFDALVLLLDRAMKLRRLRMEVQDLRKQVAEVNTPRKIIGDSPSMVKMLDLLRRITETQTTVLITGESGTGKELVARAIHDGGERRNGPFIAINCAAMPENLLESELFGHAKGAFTDARTARSGLFVQANGGTIFLDEIGEMPAGMQAKLLRALQERVVRPVGGDAEVPFDARLVAATHRDLEQEVEAKRFREDLFYRINVVGIRLPPLRARGSDVLTLAAQFLDRFVASSRREKLVGFTPAVADRLLAYPWPGNVRELQNCIEHAATLARGGRVALEDLPEKIREHKLGRLDVVPPGNDATSMPTMDEVERRYIRQVLDAVSGNKSLAAQVLGFDRRTLYRKLERIELEDARNKAGLEPANANA